MTSETYPGRNDAGIDMVSESSPSPDGEPEKGVPRKSQPFKYKPIGFWSDDQKSPASDGRRGGE